MNSEIASIGECAVGVPDSIDVIQESLYEIAYAPDVHSRVYLLDQPLFDQPLHIWTELVRVIDIVRWND
jgi:hypothetical protein